VLRAASYEDVQGAHWVIGVNDSTFAATSSVSPLTSLAVASSAFIVPLALSASSSPSPNHPRILFWYWSLRKPFFKPKDWVIPVAWFGIEGALATAAYRLLQSNPSVARSRALAWLGWNVALIGGWSRLFFKRRLLGVSTLAAVSMVASGAEYIRQAKRVDSVAARAGIPFLAWVSFATVLTGTIWALNRKR
jgi:benzodiazapine receptor